MLPEYVARDTRTQREFGFSGDHASSLKTQSSAAGIRSGAHLQYNKCEIFLLISLFNYSVDETIWIMLLHDIFEVASSPSVGVLHLPRAWDIPGVVSSASPVEAILL